MMKKRRRRLIICCFAAIGILLVGILTIEIVSSLTNRDVDTSEGLKVIKKAESGDVKKIENKIDKLAEKNKKETDTNEERNYKAVFSDSVIMGDSISEAFIEYDLLNASSVVAKKGAHLDELEEQLTCVQRINPQVIFLYFGMNDVVSTDGDADLFIKKYNALIQKIQKKLPDTKIFVNSVFPVREEVMKQEPAYKKLSDYNEALANMCDKKQIAFINNTDLVSDKDYEEDGIHFKTEFYAYWLNRMSEVASL
jgi:lysophospholipase L1-like esterase